GLPLLICLRQPIQLGPLEIRCAIEICDLLSSDRKKFQQFKPRLRLPLSRASLERLIARPHRQRFLLTFRFGFAGLRIYYFTRSFSLQPDIRFGGLQGGARLAESDTETNALPARLIFGQFE